MRRNVFFDLETTGLDPVVNQIIQIAAVAVNEEFEPIDEFEIKLRFDAARANPEALAKNSYSPKVWEDHAVEPLRAVRLFSMFLKKHATIEKISNGGKKYKLAQMAGHNASGFDYRFVRKLYEDHGEFLVGSFSVLDTWELSKWLSILAPQIQVEGTSLGALCQTFGISLEGAHDALADVRATAKLAKTMINVLSSRTDVLF